MAVTIPWWKPATQPTTPVPTMDNNKVDTIPYTFHGPTYRPMNRCTRLQFVSEGEGRNCRLSICPCPMELWRIIGWQVWHGFIIGGGRQAQHGGEHVTAGEPDVPQS